MKKSYFMAVVTVIIWGTMASVVKTLLTDMPNFQMMAGAGLFAVLFLGGLVILTGKRQTLLSMQPRQTLLMLALGFLGIFLYTALYNHGLSVLTAQEACIINYLWPAMLVLFSCLILREPFTVRKVAAIAISFLGIVLLSWQHLGSGHTAGAAGGILACFAAAVFYGLFSVLNKKQHWDETVSMLFFWGITAVLSLICSLLFENRIRFSPMQWLGVAYVGICADGLAYMLWAKALQGAGRNTARIANLAYLTPVLSVFFSALFLKERMSGAAWIALIFILAGILIQNLPERNRT